MTVLKHTDARKPVAFDLGDVAACADRLVADARAAAEAIIRQGRDEAARQAREAVAQARADGHGEGFEAGRAEGREAAHAEALGEVRSELEALLAAWREALGDLESRREHLLEQARADVIRFALEVARKVVLRQVAADGSVVADQVEEALQCLSRPHEPVVIINPDDRALLEERLPGLLERLGSCRHVHLRDDPALVRGGCIVRTDKGEVDATIESQLDAIAEMMGGGGR